MARPKFQWNADLDAALIDCRRKGMTYLECEARLGIDKLLIGPRCVMLGINKRMNRGRTSSAAIYRDRSA